MHTYLTVRDLARKSNDRIMEIMALQQLGAIHLDLEKFDDTIRFYRRSLELAEEVGDVSKSCQALSELGNSYILTGELEQAIDAFRRCSNLAQQAQDAYKEGISLFNLGMALQEFDREESKAILSRSFDILEKISYPELDHLKELAKKNLI